MRKKKSKRKWGTPGHSKAEKRLRHAFDVLDHDHDKEIDFEEFVLACDAPMERETIGVLFDMIDENDNGTIEVGELVHALQTNKKAIALAKGFAPLQKLISESHEERRENARSRRRATKKKAKSSHRKKHRKTHKKDDKDGGKQQHSKPKLVRQRSGTLSVDQLDALHAASRAADRQGANQRPKMVRRKSGHR